MPNETVVISEDVLRDWPLPEPEEGGDKEARGAVLIVGGARSTPGAIILAGVAALRAGAGKLQIGTCASVAQSVGVAVPESLVVGFPEAESGDIQPSAAEQIVERANRTAAVLIGAGMLDEDVVRALMEGVLPRIDGPTVVLDAGALTSLAGRPEALRELDGRVILTPHAGEMARLSGVDKESITRDPAGMALRAAAAWRAVVVLKGSVTHIAAPDGRTYCFKGGTIGLATSGSGDTLAGVIAGLAARGADPVQAASWGVYLHGTAGERLADRMGTLGFLARELLAEIPPVMAALGPPHS